MEHALDARDFGRGSRRGRHADAARPAASSVSLLWVSVTGASVAAFLALATASQTYLSMRTHGHSFARILMWQLGCWSFWALVAPWVIRASGRQGFLRLAGLGIGLTLAQGAMAAQLAIWLQPYLPFVNNNFGRAVLNLWWFVVLIDPLIFGLLVVGGRAFAVFQRSRYLELRESQLEAQLARAQLDALRLEIQPHFLFNTLNTISALIRTHDNAAALSMLVGLSDLMRATLEQPAGQLAPLGRELRLITQYVDLQRARFGDRLEVAYHVEPGCDALAVPVLLLQPLVENALKHGLAPQARTCRLAIGAALHGDSELRLWVADDGRGLPVGFDIDRDGGTGLRNTRARLARLYDGAATLAVRPGADAGTIVELTLPLAPLAAIDRSRRGAA
jgi:two-component system LytT family sensor kinase